MCNNCSTTSSTTGSPKEIQVYQVVITGLFCFVLGVVLATFLLRIPKLYRLLLSIPCPRLPKCRTKADKEPPSAVVVDDLPYAMTELRFRGPEQTTECTTTTPKRIKGYQDFNSESRKTFHKYTPFEAQLNAGYSAEDFPDGGYEYMHIDIESKNQDNDGPKLDENHCYFILEPQTRQPMNNVRRVNDEEELQYYNPDHIYFILEPNSTKLKPVDATNQNIQRKTDHIYFVLEKEHQGHYMSSNVCDNGSS